MYSKVKVKDRVRVPPNIFDEELEQALTKVIQEEYEGSLSKNNGILIMLSEIIEVGDGTILPEDGAVYYDTTFEMITWKPVLQEVIEGKISEVREFGIFVRIGAIDGLVHMSQVMDDFVSYSKGGIVGKSSKESMKIGDDVRTRVIAVSMKSKESAKIGLTMRQKGLGKIDTLKKEFEEKKKGKSKKK